MSRALTGNHRLISILSCVWLSFICDTGTALLTVSNHTSIGDDPGLMANLVGWGPIWHEKHRWGICAQDMCFKNAFASAFCGAGQVLPVNRGAGVDQPLMASIARKVRTYVDRTLFVVCSLALW
jgi:hypothetical protein